MFQVPPFAQCMVLLSFMSIKIMHSSPANIARLFFINNLFLEIRPSSFNLVNLDKSSLVRDTKMLELVPIGLFFLKEKGNLWQLLRLSMSSFWAEHDLILLNIILCSLSTFRCVNVLSG